MSETWSRARVARRIAAAALYGGSGIGLLGGAAVGLLLTEVRLARRVVGGGGAVPPTADGRYGAAFGKRGLPPIRLAFLGDSTAAGQGVQHAGETPAALLASGLAAVAGRPVDLVNAAVPGARSDSLADQAERLLPDGGPAPDLCVIMIGANDVTHRMPPAESVRYLAETVRRLRDAGAGIVVGTCPDLGTIEPVYQPLRWVARRLSRQLAAAQTIAVVELGGRAVSLGQLLGPEFEARPSELFGPDNYHPSAAGYATAAVAILPTLCAAAGVWPEEERTEVLLPVDQAAAQAAGQGGTEVAAAGPGQRGRWAFLKRRTRGVPAQAAGPEAAPVQTARSATG